MWSRWTRPFGFYTLLSSEFCKVAPLGVGVDRSDWPRTIRSVEARRPAWARRRRAALLVTMALFVQTHRNNMPEEEKETPACQRRGAALLLMCEKQKWLRESERLLYFWFWFWFLLYEAGKGRGTLFCSQDRLVFKPPPFFFFFHSPSSCPINDFVRCDSSKSGGIQGHRPFNVDVSHWRIFSEPFPLKLSDKAAPSHLGFFLLSNRYNKHKHGYCNNNKSL